MVSPIDAQPPGTPRAVGFLLQLAVFDSVVSINPAAAEDSSLSRQLLWGALGLAAIIYLVVVRLSQSDRNFSFGGWPLAMLLLYVFASTAWSVTPLATIKRDILLAFLVAVCSVSVGSSNADWRKDVFSTLLATPMAWLVGLAMVVTLVAPGRAFTELGWRGLASQKNLAGQMMALTLLLLFYGVCHDKLRKWTRIFIILFATTLLLLSKSTTALLGLAFCVSATELLTLRTTIRHLATWKLALVGVFLVGSALLYFAFILQVLPGAGELYSKGLGILGKSETFTGRTAIWNLVLGESRFHNTWLGGGYGGFWVGRNSISGYVIVGNDLYPGQAHNGYIDIYNDLGILGIFVLAVVLVASLYQAQRVLALRVAEGKIHLAIPLICLFLNLGESTFFRSTNFMNIIFLASFIRAASILRQARASHLVLGPVATVTCSVNNI